MVCSRNVLFVAPNGMLKVRSWLQSLLKLHALEAHVQQLTSKLRGQGPRWEAARKAAFSLVIYQLQVRLCKPSPISDISRLSTIGDDDQQSAPNTVSAACCPEARSSSATSGDAVGSHPRTHGDRRHKHRRCCFAGAGQQFVPAIMRTFNTCRHDRCLLNISVDAAVQCSGLSKTLKEMEDLAHSHAGQKFSLTAPQQVRQILFQVFLILLIVCKLAWCDSIRAFSPTSQVLNIPVPPIALEGAGDKLAVAPSTRLEVCVLCVVS